jgi:hypothetical protein
VRLVAAPAAARLVVADARPAGADENPNEGYRRLLVQVPAPSTPTALTLTIALVVGDGALPELPAGGLETWAGQAP